jgi:hypothetical protein
LVAEAASAGVFFTEVGRVVEGADVRVRSAGRWLSVRRPGYRHGG